MCVDATNSISFAGRDSERPAKDREAALLCGSCAGSSGIARIRGTPETGAKVMDDRVASESQPKEVVKMVVIDRFENGFAVTIMCDCPKVYVFESLAAVVHFVEAKLSTQ